MDELLSFVTENFWLVILVVTLICNKSCRTGGILLLTTQAVFGFIPWLVITLVILTIGGSEVGYYRSYEKSKENIGTEQKLPGTRRDPDYE